MLFLSRGDQSDVCLLCTLTVTGNLSPFSCGMSPRVHRLSRRFVTSTADQFDWCLCYSGVDWRPVHCLSWCVPTLIGNQSWLGLYMPDRLVTNLFIYVCALTRTGSQSVISSSLCAGQCLVTNPPFAYRWPDMNWRPIHVLNLHFLWYSTASVKCWRTSWCWWLWG